MVAVCVYLGFLACLQFLVVTWECWVLGTGSQNISEQGHGLSLCLQSTEEV